MALGEAVSASVKYRGTSSRRPARRRSCQGREAVGAVGAVSAVRKACRNRYDPLVRGSIPGSGWKGPRSASGFAP